MDKPAGCSSSPHDVGIVLNIATGRHTVGESRNIAGSISLTQLATPLQIITERHVIRRSPRCTQLDDRLVDHAVCISVKVGCLKEITYQVVGLWINDEAA